MTSAPSTSKNGSEGCRPSGDFHIHPPDLELLMAENKDLKATLKGLSRELSRRMNIIADELGPDGWTKMEARWVTKVQELAELQVEEEQLEQVVKELKGSVCEVGRELREKEKTAWELEEKVAWLKVGEGLQMLTPAGPLDAVSLLPEELWGVIFGKVDDPCDLWNCFNTCLLFERMLYPWKSGWALEQALPYLREHHLSKFESWDTVLTRILETHPSLQPHQEGNDPRRLDFIYPVKQAGIDWNVCFFSDDPRDDHSDLEETEQRYKRIPFLSRCLNWIRDRRVVYRFNADPANGAAPGVLVGSTRDRKLTFIGRYLNLVIGRGKISSEEQVGANAEDRQKWWGHLYTFFDLYGRDIWYLTLAITVDSKRDVWVKNKLKHFLTFKLFQSCPNLRKLDIAHMDLDWDVLIKPTLIPSAPKLETLGGRSGNPLPQAFAMRFHGQLRKLSMTAAWDMDSFIESLDWPNLVELHLVDLGLQEVKVIWGFRWLLRVKMPQLRKLGLAFSVVQEVSMENLMELIEGLSSRTRLSSLRLVGPLHLLRFQDGNKVHPAPPTLKTLEIANPWTSSSPSPISFDFLFHCFPFLENLNVFFMKEPERLFLYRMETDLMPQMELKKMAAKLEPVEELFVEMNKFMWDGKMYKSNIWEMLPLLKVFTFQWEVFTRERYELTRI